MVNNPLKMEYENIRKLQRISQYMDIFQKLNNNIAFHESFYKYIYNNIVEIYVKKQISKRNSQYLNHLKHVT